MHGGRRHVRLRPSIATNVHAFSNLTHLHNTRITLCPNLTHRTVSRHTSAYLPVVGRPCCSSSVNSGGMASLACFNT
ncbi:unnamed protein product [Sphagnum balticum]